MNYEDVPKMRSIYPFLEGSTKEEVISLLQESISKAPDDVEFAMACRLELLWRSKQAERQS